MRFLFGPREKPAPAPGPASAPAAPRVVGPVPEPARPAPAVTARSAGEPQPAPQPASGSSGKAREIALYQALLSGLYDGVLILDAKGHVIASNRRIEQFTGYSEAELWNMPCDQLIAAMTPRVLAKITAYIEAGRFTVVNAECRRKDGTPFSAEIAISRIHFLQPGDFVFSIRNLDRREKARLRHELEIDALRHAGAGMAVCSLEGMIEYANPAFVRLLNVPGEKDLLSQRLDDVCVAPEAAAALRRETAAHGFWYGRLDLRTLDGVVRPVIATTGLSPAKQAAPARLVLTLTDVPGTIG